MATTKGMTELIAAPRQSQGGTVTSGLASVRARRNHDGLRPPLLIQIAAPFLPRLSRYTKTIAGNVSGRTQGLSMPNGGSDCCGTCWFNARNNGEAGYAHTRDPEPALCAIRNLPIADPFYTYCANHPHRRPQRDSVPIGPVFIGDSTGARKLCQPSPDTLEVRQHLLALLDDIQAKPTSEYPIGVFADELVVWQLGEFQERRAVAGLQHIASFDPRSEEDGPFKRTRQDLVKFAQEALAKIARAGGHG